MDAPAVFTTVQMNTQRTTERALEWNRTRHAADRTNSSPQRTKPGRLSRVRAIAETTDEGNTRVPVRSTFETDDDIADTAASARLLAKLGYLPADSPDTFRGGLNLLVDHLRQEPVPAREILTRRVEQYATGDRPYLPRPSREFPASETFTAWINPARVLLKYPGTRSFIHDTSHSARRAQTGPGRADYKPTEPKAGISEFAERIAGERGDPDGLRELFGEPDEPAVQVEAWNMPIGPLFRVDTNGNHRLTALAALAVPCVLAEVRLHTGLFDTSPAASMNELDDIAGYRRLLQTFGVAAFADFGMMGAFGISTEWPILIRDPASAAKSLTFMERINAAPITTNIGGLPRSWFTSADELRTASHDLGSALDRFVARRTKRRTSLFRRR